jgi:hypothetical protein
MAPGIFRKIFDKVKGFFNGGDDSQASNLVDRIKGKVTQVSDGARHVIDKVNETIDYAEPVVRKGIRKTSEVLDYAEPVVEQASRIVRKIRREPKVDRSYHDEDEYEPPRRALKTVSDTGSRTSTTLDEAGGRTTKIIPRTFKPYKLPEIEPDSDENDRDSEPASIRKQTSKFDNPSTQRTKLRPILKPKKAVKPEFYSD